MDLVIATAIIVGASVFAFWAGRSVCKNRKFLFLATIATVFVFGCFLQGKLGLASIFQASSSVLLSNFTPVLIALIAGYACRGLEIRPGSRPAFVATLVAAAFFCLMGPIIRAKLAPAEPGFPVSCEHGFVMQSHESTCAPAAAANLLRLHGIDTTEAELVGPCLTSEFGTESLGLFRGLKLRCKNHDLDVSLASRNPMQWKARGQLPNVAIVRFAQDEYSGSVTKEDLDEFNRRRKLSKARVASANLLPVWLFGDGGTIGHVVVVKDFVEGKWIVVDPAIGVVEWTDRELAGRFTGDAIFLSSKSGFTD